VCAGRQEHPAARQRRVNVRFTAGPPTQGGVRTAARTQKGRPDTERTADVADLLYVGLVIVMFAVLVLAARGLERL
jgi:hypothetical protein